MSHRNAPLTPAGRRILVERIGGGRPIVHVAIEMGIGRYRMRYMRNQGFAKDVAEAAEAVAALEQAKPDDEIDYSIVPEFILGIADKTLDDDDQIQGHCCIR